MRKHDPRTKEELLDRMLSFDFDGDIRHLGREPASIVRAGANTLLLSFPASGRTYELTVHIPRDGKSVAKAGAFRPAEDRAFSNEPPLPEAEIEASLKEEQREKRRQAPREQRRASN